MTKKAKKVIEYHYWITFSMFTITIFIGVLN